MIMDKIAAEVNATQPNSREELIKNLPPEYKKVFDVWSDEDVKKYVFLINSSSPQDTFDRTLRPDLLGLATALHERVEMLIMANLLSQKKGSDFHFADKIRSGKLQVNDVQGYFQKDNDPQPRKLYLEAHRQAYRTEMDFLRNLAKKNGIELPLSALFATSPRLLNSHSERLNDLKYYQFFYDSEKVTQLGEAAKLDDYATFPTSEEIKMALNFWQSFGGEPYSSQTKNALKNLKFID